MKKLAAFFSDPSQLNKDLDKAKTNYNDYKAKKQITLDREANFISCTTQLLMQIYDNSQKLVPSAEDPGLLQIINQYLQDAATLLKAVAVSGGLGAIASYLVGKPDMAIKAAVVCSIPGALCALWDVKTAEEARIKARGFLRLVQDLKGDPTKIKLRMNSIAKALCLRFKYAIHLLPADETGVESLCHFFTAIIARDIPNQGTHCLTSNSTPWQIIHVAVTTAIPQSSDDPFYKGWFQNKKLSTDDKKDWTVPGLLLRGPIYAMQTKLYYVRDGKHSREKKYPPQIVNKQLPRYVMADTVQINNIRTCHLSIDEKLNRAKRKYQLLLNKVSKSGISDELDPPPMIGVSYSLYKKAYELQQRVIEEEKIYQKMRESSWVYR